MNKEIILILSFTTLCQSQITFDSTGRSYATIFGIILEKITFKDVFKILGEAKYYQSGDAGESEKRVHYFLKKENEYISFTSGEMGGGTNVDGIIISKIKPIEEYSKKDSIALYPNDIGGIKLGIAKELFYKSIPKAAILDKSNPKYNKYGFVGKKPDTLIEFENEIPMTSEDIIKTGTTNPKYQKWYECISITPTFRDNNLIKIRINKTTSD